VVSGVFWWVLVHTGGFYCVLVASSVFYWVLLGSSVLAGSDVFGWFRAF
jgi:hypothetical protein